MKRLGKKFLSYILCLFFCVDCFYSNITVSAQTEETFKLGNFSEDNKFSDATGNGIVEYCSLVIGFSNKISAESLDLPEIDGYTYESRLSTEGYSYVISFEPKTVQTVAEEYIREITFSDIQDGTEIYATLSNDYVNTKTIYWAPNGHFYQFIKFADAANALPWTDSYDLARGSFFAGRQGYLATITSVEEDTFIRNASSEVGWLGGTILKGIGGEGTQFYDSFDQELPSSINREDYPWYWACGPEKGDKFFDYSTVNQEVEQTRNEYSEQIEKYYFNWRNNYDSNEGKEPNNGGEGTTIEHCLTTLRFAPGYSTSDIISDYSWNNIDYQNINDPDWYPEYGAKGYFVEYGDQRIGNSTTNIGKYDGKSITDVVRPYKNIAEVTKEPEANDLVYTGEIQELIIAGSAEGGEMLYSLDGINFSATIPTGKDAGTYTVYYRVIGDSDHNNTDIYSLSVEIEKAPLVIEKEILAEKTYDGTTDAEVKEVIISGLKNDETLEEGTDYVVTGEFDNTDATGENAATKATVTVTLLDTETTKNYYMPKNTITFSQRINKADPIYDNDLSFTVKEGKKLSDLKLPISENGIYTWVEDSNMSVGSIGENIFHVNYTPKDTNNYNIIYNIPVKVIVTAKKIRDLEFETEWISKTYGDENFTQVVSGAATEITYESDNTKVAEVNSRTGEVTIKGAGASIIKAIAAETEEYAKTETKYMLTVNKKSVELPVAKTNLIYNGEEQTGVELTEDAVYKLTENTKTNAGDYKVVAALKDKNNYQWNIESSSSNDQIIPWSIAKKKIKVKADDKSSIVGENLVELTYTSDGLLSGDKFIGNLKTYADKNKAGTYKISQGTLTAGDNYEIEFISGIYAVLAKPQPIPSPSGGGGDYSGGVGWNVLTPSTNAEITNNTVTGEKTDASQNTKVVTKETLKDIKLPDELKTRKYINGYEDKTFKPEQNITRAEVAQAIYKLINKGEAINYDVLARFSDVETGKWYSKAIAYLAEKNIISGSDGKYNPESSITRAETAQILLNLLKSYDTGGKDYAYGSNSYDFSDIDGWYSETIKQLASNGMINGYADKTFRPNEKIKRSEFIVMIAKVFGRNVEDTSAVQKFPDVLSDYWAVKYINDAAE